MLSAKCRSAINMAIWKISILHIVRSDQIYLRSGVAKLHTLLAVFATSVFGIKIVGSRHLISSVLIKIKEFGCLYLHNNSYRGQNTVIGGQLGRSRIQDNLILIVKATIKYNNQKMILGGGTWQIGMAIVIIRITPWQLT